MMSSTVTVDNSPTPHMTTLVDDVQRVVEAKWRNQQPTREITLGFEPVAVCSPTRATTLTWSG